MIAEDGLEVLTCIDIVRSKQSVFIAIRADDDSYFHELAFAELDKTVTMSRVGVADGDEAVLDKRVLFIVALRVTKGTEWRHRNALGDEVQLTRETTLVKADWDRLVARR